MPFNAFSNQWHISKNMASLPSNMPKVNVLQFARVMADQSCALVSSAQLSYQLKLLSCLSSLYSASWKQRT